MSSVAAPTVAAARPSLDQKASRGTILLFLLLLGWFWRVGLWARFLWLMSRLELKLVPSHPDGAGGLGFLSTSLEAFLPLAFGFGVLGAGPVLNFVVHRGASPQQ